NTLCPKPQPVRNAMFPTSPYRLETNSGFQWPRISAGYVLSAMGPSAKVNQSRKTSSGESRGNNPVTFRQSNYSSASRHHKSFTKLVGNGEKFWTRKVPCVIPWRIVRHSYFANCGPRWTESGEVSRCDRP